MECKGTVYTIGGKNYCVGEKSSSKKYGTRSKNKRKKRNRQTKKKR